MMENPNLVGISAGLEQPVRTERTAMTLITRRAALCGIASIPATAAPGRALSLPGSAVPEIDPPAPAAASARAELPSERVMRLGKELSVALDELNADLVANPEDYDEVGIWIARVWPRSVNPHVCLEQVGLPAGQARFARARS